MGGVSGVGKLGVCVQGEVMALERRAGAGCRDVQLRRGEHEAGEEWG